MEGTHTPEAMVGYVGKNEGQLGFQRFRKRNISDAHIARGTEIYKSNNTELFKNKHPCGVTNWFKCCVAFGEKYLHGFPCPFEVNLLCMVKSKLYSFGEVWATAKTGQHFGGIIFEKAELLFKAIKCPEKFSLQDLQLKIEMYIYMYAYNKNIITVIINIII